MTEAVSTRVPGRVRGRRRVLFCTNRYRAYDRRMYEVLVEAFDLRVLWISPPPSGEPLPADLGARLRWSVVDESSAKLAAADVRRSTALFRAALREARDCDLVVAATSNSWKARVLFVAARVAGAPIAMRTDVWRDRVVGAPRGARALYWGLQRRITGLLERRATGMLASGVKTTEYLAAHGIVPERISTFRYLHADLAALPVDRAVVDRLRAIKGDRIAFLYLGRVMEQKGLVPLIRVFRSILATGRDAVLFVVGSPITEDTGRGAVSVEYFAEAQRLAAGDPRIVFFGQVPSAVVPSYYAAADVFVHPHVAVVQGEDVFEAWCNTITEAASMGLPIVATDRVPSCFDIVQPGSSGEILPAEHVEDRLAAALVPFIDRPELARTWGRAARRSYEAFADPALNVEALHRVMDRAGR